MVTTLPIIDISELRNLNDDGRFNEKALNVCKQIGEACHKFGFFYISNHGVSEELINKLMNEGRRFFKMPVDYKNKYHMRNSKVYRGYFEVGGGRLLSYLWELVIYIPRRVNVW